ncbi:MAG: tetratricopeptide repeat protein [Myxococcota bacterium]
MSGHPPPDPCPDEAVIAEFAQGALSPAQAERLEAHLDACEACSRVVAELARIFAGDDAGLGEDGQASENGGEDGIEDESEDGSEAATKDATSPVCAGPRGEPMLSDQFAATIGAEKEEPPQRLLGRLLPAGAEVGRYRVLDCVGVGAMGVVYSAYDPELDRRVALKLLRSTKGRAGSGGGNARLLREAQALARLTHPSVITVHDVGTWQEQVFVAMEYVEGSTLKAWLAERRRQWPEIRDVFVAAGRGLAAAHEADLVHRDFKPDNVLIGKDGRVRVTDFGLARWGHGPSSFAEMMATDERLASQLRESTSGPIKVRNPEVSLTRTGTLVGTPAYMSPEQHEQRPADPSSDQFAFCVALYEAIYGERPFKGRTLAELASKVIEGRLPAASPGASVPREVRQALRRGLSRNRRDRFASMDDLLAVLDRRDARGRRAWVLSGLGLVVAGGGLWAWAGATTTVDSAFCRTEQGLGETWTPTRREAIDEAFRLTGVPYAEPSAARALEEIDQYVIRWERLRARSCNASALADEGPAVTALRERCLERRRVSLEALLEAFEQPEAETVARAVGAVVGLPAVEHCGDRETLVAELPPTPPPALRDAVEAMRDELARVDGLIAAGRYHEGIELARRLDMEAEGLGHEPLRAETLFLVAQLLDRTGDLEAAIDAFEDASLRAIASRHRRVLVDALIERVYAFGVSTSRIEEAERLARRAEAEIEGLGMGDDTQAALWLNWGSVAYRKGDYEAADRLIRRSLALRDKERDPLRWADAAFNLATVSLTLGDTDEALARLESYVEIFEARLGRMHPEVASGYHNLAIAYSTAERLDEAYAAVEQSEVIRRETLGQTHPHFAISLNTKGSILTQMGRVEEGMLLIRRSIRILEAHGEDPIEIAHHRVELAQALVELDRLDEAEEQAEQARVIFEQELGPEHSNVASALRVLAWSAAGRGDRVKMERLMERTHAILVGALGVDNPEVIGHEIVRASMLASAGQPEPARDQLRQFIDERQGKPADESLVAAWIALADVLWADQEQRLRARGLIRAGQRLVSEQGLGAQVTRLGRWLDQHPLAR